MCVRVEETVSMSEISAEASWILSTCREALIGGGGASDGAAEDLSELDWRQVAASVATSKSGALLSWRERKVPRMPEWLDEMTRASLQYNRLRSTHLFGALDEVAAALPADARVIARKGVHLAWLYPDPSTRAFADIDLLVHRDDTERLAQALASIGYAQGRLSPDRRNLEPFDRATLLYYRVGTSAIPPFIKIFPDDEAVGLAMVDFATQLLPPRLGAGLELDEAWSRRAYVEGTPVPVLSTEDLLLDTCANLYVTNTTLHYVWARRYCRLTAYLDLLVVIGGGLDWDRFLDLIAAKPETATSVHFALGNLDRLFPGLVPASALDRLVTLGASPESLDVIGELELDEPYRWEVGLVERMFTSYFPSDLPAASSLV
jgi:hypothetical protein